MYCQNCGKKCDEKAVICVGCGVPLNNNYQNTNANNVIQTEKKGKGIASMILGILSTLYALMAFAAFEDLDRELLFYDSAEKFGFAFGFVLIQSVLAIIAICLACSERKTKKNGFNTAGFWLSLITFAMIAIQFIYVITY